MKNGAKQPDDGTNERQDMSPLGRSGVGAASPQPRSGWWRLWIWLGLALLIALWINQPRPDSVTAIPYSQFKKELLAGNVDFLEAEGETLRGRFEEPVASEVSDDTGDAAETPATELTEFETTLPPFGDDQLTEQLMRGNVELVSRGAGNDMLWIALANMLPFIVLIGLAIYWIRSMAQRTQGVMGIGQSRAKKFDREKPSTKFDDVAGADSAKEDLQEIIAFLRDPKKFLDLGAELPRGMLLVGPPGTGKTLLARAVAGEANVPFFSISGSDFMEMFVGVGASRVRNLFETAKQNAPCIIFLDEIDSIGRRRGAGVGGGHDEREQTLNQLLSELDGFEQTDNVILMAATNRPDILDPALLRPGRFDRQVSVDLPSYQDRVAILKVHAKKTPLADDVNLDELAKTMPGRSGADLRNLVNEAALIAAKNGHDKLHHADFTAARDKLLMGRVRSGIVLEGHEKRVVAVHEAGHALVGHLTPGSDPIEKISIIARGRALGVTQQLGEERYNLSEEFIRAKLTMMLGGRAAEECVFDSVSTGAADDLSKVSELARKVVSEWGMSEKFRHLAFEQNGHGRVFLGEQMAEQRPYSDDTAREIDLEVKNIVEKCYSNALAILRNNRDRLGHVADMLEANETLEGGRLTEALGEVIR